MTRRLALHAGALLLVLLVVSPFATAHGIFHADEGAVLAEARLLHESGSWTAANPQPDLDPEMEALPLELSDRFEGGRWAPFLKHPLYPPIIGLLYGLGPVGWVLPSIVGTVVAAVGSGILAGRLRAGAEPYGLWAAGLATPLLFQSYVVQAHTLAAGAAALAAVAADRALGSDGRVRVGAVAGASAAVLVGVLLRTESLFIGLAIGAALALASRLRPSAIVAAGAIGLVAVATWRLEPRLLVPAIEGRTSLGGILAGRAVIESGGDPVGAFQLTVLDASFGGRRSALLGAVGTLAALVTALAARRGLRLVVLAGAVATLLAFAVRAGDGGLIPGLLPCTPLLVGLVGLDRDSLRNRTASFLLVAAVLYAGAITLTQYNNGGGATWGGRFFAAGLPLVVPLAVVGWMTLVELLDAVAGRVVRCSMAGAVALLAILAVGSMRDHRSLFEGIVDDVLDARTVEGGTAPVLATTGIPPRFAWEHVEDGVWLTVEPDSLPRYLERLRERGGPVVLVTFDPDLDLPATSEDYRLVEERGAFVFLLEPR